MVPVANPAVILVPAGLFVLIGWVHYRLHRRRGEDPGFAGHVFPAAVYRRSTGPIGLLNYVLSASLLFKGSGGVAAILTAQWLFAWIAPGWDSPPMHRLLAAAGQVLLIWLARDLGNYLQHLAQHKSRILWRLHRPHHAVEELTPFVQVQGHPLDLLMGTILAFPIILLGTLLALAATGGLILPETLAGLVVVAGIEQLKGALGHSHLPISFGRWNRLILAPVMHQLHHSADPQHRGRNLGSTFGLWDWLFGTLYIPAPGETWRLGLDPHLLGANSPYRRIADIYVEPVTAAFGEAMGGISQRRP
jgi:sterol desaturase/sphingolipid hydroxylase (fatty acid hydroxylase superfamily)